MLASSQNDKKAGDSACNVLEPESCATRVMPARCVVSVGIPTMYADWS